MSDVPSFERCRRESYKLLGNAADWIRAGDWDPPPNADQKAAILNALHHIGEAKAALNEAADRG